MNEDSPRRHRGPFDPSQPRSPRPFRPTAAPAASGAPGPHLVEPPYHASHGGKPRESRQLPPPVIRRARRSNWLEAALLAAYSLVVALGIAWHEPWADEGQAWLLGRDTGWWELMMHRIRYEGSPGLWHSLLWLLARLHVGYIGMHWVSGAIAAAGIFVLVRWSPFPLALRILLPFGFWLAYQDAVVARSYVLFAILAFPAAALLRSLARTASNAPPHRRRLLWLALLLGLMANISIHGFIASLGFAIVAWSLSRAQAKAGIRWKKAAPALVLCFFWLFAIVTTFPPSDVDFPAGKNLERSTDQIWARLGSKEAKTELRDEALRGTKPLPGELPMQSSRAFQRTPGEARWHKIARFLSIVTFPVSNSRALALAACFLIVVQAIVFRPARGYAGQIGWIGIMPWALMVVIFTWMYLAPRHAGMVWEALVAALWLTWPAEPISSGRAFWLRSLTLVALVLVGVNQAWWTAHSVWADIHQPYCGDEAMANFLQKHGAGKRIAGFGYHSVGVDAFFNHKIFFNQPAAYWVWSQKPRLDARAPFTIATHPDIIVVGGWDWGARNADLSEDWIKPDPEDLNSVPLNDGFHIIPYAEAHGYRETHRFCGHAFLRGGYSEELCQVALEPVK